MNHLSCWRSTPWERRKRSPTETTEATMQVASTPSRTAPRTVTATIASPPVTATGRQRDDGSRPVEFFYTADHYRTFRRFAATEPGR